MSTFSKSSAFRDLGVKATVDRDTCSEGDFKVTAKAHVIFLISGSTAHKIVSL